jgi:ArsR family transcriptional regulator, arsenate/arsenite/antimonite-responsive transcriptional repressor
MNVDTLRSLPVLAAPDCCRPIASTPLSDTEARNAAAVFKALADPARVRLVNLLATADGEVCACELTPALGLSQPTVSHHLKKLVQSGLLTREQRGVWAYYSLDRDALARAAGILATEGATP